MEETKEIMEEENHQNDKTIIPLQADRYIELFYEKRDYRTHFVTAFAWKSGNKVPLPSITYKTEPRPRRTLKDHFGEKRLRFSIADNEKIQSQFDYLGNECKITKCRILFHIIDLWRSYLISQIDWKQDNDDFLDIFEVMGETRWVEILGDLERRKTKQFLPRYLQGALIGLTEDGPIPPIRTQILTSFNLDRNINKDQINQDPCDIDIQELIGQMGKLDTSPSIFHGHLDLITQRIRKVSKRSLRIQKKVKGFNRKYPNNKYSNEEIETIVQIGLKEYIRKDIRHMMKDKKINRRPKVQNTRVPVVM